MSSSCSFNSQLQKLKGCLDAIDIGQMQSMLDAALKVFGDAIRSNDPILVCGNGGSAADAQHIAGELVGKFFRERRALNVRSLACDTSVLTAWANDVTYDTVFARQVEAYGQRGGVLWAISTSGNSRNVLAACMKAKELGLTVVGMTGEGGGEVAEFADVLLTVPSRDTPRIQEMHLMLYHYICEQIEVAI